MSLSPTIVNYRKLTGQIYFNRIQRAFIEAMPELEGYEWEGLHLKRPPWNWGDGVIIKELTSHISLALDELQGEYCIYCGMRFDVTSGKEIEHIAPKGKGRYPKFMFEPLNMAHSCSLCNGFEKKEREEYWDTIEGEPDDNYSECKFKIVHPYFDEPDIHFEFLYILGDESSVAIRGKTNEGRHSIKTFKLDEEPLTTERAKHVERWAKKQNSVLEKIIYDTLIATNNL